MINERKFDLGSGTLGNGVTVWNSAKEVHGDYETIAHIDRNRKVTYYIKNPPKEVTNYVDKIVKGKNFAMSATTPHMKTFNEELINKYLNEINKRVKVNKGMIDDKKIKEGDRVRVNKDMIGGGNIGRVIELNSDIAIIKFNKKVQGNSIASYFIDDLQKI